jgi:predicted  nucleic acid-binding Zn-ribbon protein
MTNEVKKTVKKEIKEAQSELEEIRKEIQHCEEIIKQNLDKGGGISPEFVVCDEKFPELIKKREEKIIFIKRLREHLANLK